MRVLPMFILLLLLSAGLSSCHVVRFFTLNFADINDYKRFPEAPVHKAGSPFIFHQAADTSGVRLPDRLMYRESPYPFDEFLKESGTVAFLMIRNDTILFERYFSDYEYASVVPSFSVAKSVISALTGIAVEEGYISSIHDPVTRYLPWLDKKEFGPVTIAHLLDMRSGIAFNEGYFNPFGDVAKYYYGTNIRKYLRRLKTSRPPDEVFEYRSVNTQLLAMILREATGKTVPEYLEEKLWTRMGMEYDAGWSLDSRKHRTEKAFCCLNARARDYAKIGRLYLHEGNWNGEQLIPREWVRQSLDFETPKNDFLYSYQWWHNRNFHPPEDSAAYAGSGLFSMIRIKDSTGHQKRMMITPANDFLARGILGQFIYVLPEKNIIIVRLGKHRKHVAWESLFRSIALNN